MSKYLRGPQPVDIEVGRRIRVARIARGISQIDLAEALGLTFQQVQKYEKGSNRIAPARLKIIAAKLDRPIAWFFGEVNYAVGLLPAELLGASKQGQRLAQAFLKIKDAKFREVVVTLAETTARALA